MDHINRTGLASYKVSVGIETEFTNQGKES
jgi:hypothetical protein